MRKQMEQEERETLEKIKGKLLEALKRLDQRVQAHAKDVQEQKEYLWEHRSDMDHVEKIAARESAQQAVRIGENVGIIMARLQKLVQIPYFGRFDFATEEKDGDAQSVYIGIHSFRDDDEKENLIFDWRAPISSMFYDYELGKARYQSPSGEISGEIRLKRQFRIRKGEMEFVLESGLNIMDDVLQKELSRASDDRMKNIVATIQRDQNAIIRNDEAQALIIQGVAGSGKTSIALHRIAYLLYKHKEFLSAKDILIISPNKVFSDFISNVLPELGEETVPEMGMEKLADELLDSKFKFQTFFEQTALLLENSDEGLRTRIKEKSTPEFLKKLDDYADEILKTRFTPTDIRIKNRTIPAQLLDRAFHRRSGIADSERLRWVAEVAEHEVNKGFWDELTSRERVELKASIKKMYKPIALRSAYKEFFIRLGRPELLKPAPKSALEYSDVFPLIYLKFRLGKVSDGYRHVKHLLVDEMQDYTPVQYAVLARLFPCEKTILGDANQSVNPYSASTIDSIAGVFKGSECVKLCKSYRSTYEITQFAQTIAPNAELIAIERHGEPPLLLSCKNEREEKDRLLNAVGEFPSTGFTTMGIICKTQKQAESLFEHIENAGLKAHLLTTKSGSFKKGIMICCAHLAKGLEFDSVHVPNASDVNYMTEMDRNLLYVACTRAMHKLTLTYVGAITSFVSK